MLIYKVYCRKMQGAYGKSTADTRFLLATVSGLLWKSYKASPTDNRGLLHVRDKCQGQCYNVGLEPGDRRGKLS